MEGQMNRLRFLIRAHPCGVYLYPQERAAGERLVELGEAEWTETGALAPKLEEQTCPTGS